MSDGREFRISNRSMAALEEYAEEAFLDRLVALVAGLAEPGEPASEIRAKCRELLGKARSHGFTTEREVGTYIACGFSAGIGFDTRSPYRAILESPGMSAFSKTELLALLLEQADDDDADDNEV